MARRLWPPAAEELRPRPVECITAELAAHVVAADLKLLWTGMGSADEGGAFVAPSKAVFVDPQRLAPGRPILKLCRLHARAHAGCSEGSASGEGPCSARGGGLLQ